MNKYLILIIIILSIFSTKSLQQGPLDPGDINAITNLFNILSQPNWIINPVEDICTANPTKILCNTAKTRIRYIHFDDPSTLLPVDMPNDIYQLSALTDLWVNSTIINIPSIFWANLPTFSGLAVLFIRKLTDPIQGIVSIPSSLNEIDIYECYTPLPDEIFTLGNQQFLIVGVSNTYDVPNLFPTTISSTSNIQIMQIRSFGSFNLIGTNFLKVTDIAIEFVDGFSTTYDLYDTWPKLSTLTITNNRWFPVNTYTFPNSILSALNIQMLSIYAENKIVFAPQLYHFPQTKLQKLLISDMDLTTMGQPGLSFSTQPWLDISESIIDLSKVDILNLSSISLYRCNYTSTLPTGSYKNLQYFSMTGGDLTGPLPQSMCDVQVSLYLTGTQISSVPDCFICNWDSHDYYSSVFQSNSLLPVYTATCPTFSMDSNYSRTPIPTTKGVMSVSGTSLGWVVYNENNQFYTPAYPLIGNKLLRFIVPDGTGINKPIQVVFHGNSITRSTPVQLLIDYLPPSIDNITTSMYDSQLTIYGSNFGPNTSYTTVTIAGQSFNTFDRVYTDPNSMLSLSNPIPYNNNITISIGVIVDGQDTYKIIKPLNADPKLYEPLPALYFKGGTIEFPGQYLTYDTTIMSLTISGMNLTNRLVKGNANMVSYSYDAMPIGTYQFEFYLDQYHLSTTIEINDVPLCTVVHGTCNGKIPVCDSPYTGPICSSLPANLSQPLPVSDQYAQAIPSTPYTLAYNGIETTLTFSIGPLNVKEFDINGQMLTNSTPIATAMQNTSAPTLETYTYTYPFGQTAMNWVAQNQSVAGFTGLKDYITSTMKFQTIFTQYQWLDPTNTLEISQRVDFEIISTNISNRCSSVSGDNLPTDTSFNYIQAKLNYLDLYSRISKTCYIDGFRNCDELTYKIISVQNNKISLEIGGKIPHFVMFAFEYDFNVLIEEDGCYNDSNSNSNPSSSSNSEPSGGTTSSTGGGGSTVTCTPKCYEKGVCVDGRCKCDQGWKGETCDSIDTKLPPITNPNTTSPDVDTTDPDNELGLHISIYQIRELDYNGKMVRSQSFLPNWNYSHVKTIEKERFNYSYSLFKNSSVQVTVDYFFIKEEIEFAGESTTKLPGSIKYSANITSWPFLSATNQLQVIFQANVEEKSESKDSCSYKSFEYSDGSLQSASIQLNGKTFTATFTDLAMVDNKITQIKNVLVPSTDQDTNTKSSVLVGINTPHHSKNLIIDPDFSLLVSYTPSKDKEGSICAKSSKKLTGAQIAGIVIGVVCFVGIVVGVVIYNIKKTRRDKGFMKKLNRISQQNSAK